MGPIPAIAGGLGAIKGIFDVGKHIYDGIKEGKKEKHSQIGIERAYQDRLNQLKQKENQLLKEKKEFDIKIKDMEKKINEQKNAFEKIKMENEKKLLEQKQKEEQRKIQEIQEKQIAINQCKKYLSEEFIMCIINSFKEYKIQEGKWIKQITKYDIENRKKNFIIYFKDYLLLNIYKIK